MRFFSAAVSFFIIFATSISSKAQIKIEVSDDYAAIHHSAKLDIAPQDLVSIDLHRNDYADSYRLYYSIPIGFVELLILDGQDRKANNAKPTPLLKRLIKGVGIVNIQAPKTIEGAILVLINRGSEPTMGRIRVDRLGSRPEEVRSKIASIVAMPIRSISKAYIVPKLSVTVKPCGEVNAFSNPDITICSELIAELVDKDLPLALWPVVLHELGHSLMWFWKIPGYDNEDTVDNFAGSMLAKTNPKAVDQYIAWFETMDPVAEAVAKLTSAGKHPLSIERAKSLRSIVRSPAPDMKRWEELLAPHLRR